MIWAAPRRTRKGACLQPRVRIRTPQIKQTREAARGSWRRMMSHETQPRYSTRGRTCMCVRACPAWCTGRTCFRRAENRITELPRSIFPRLPRLRTLPASNSATKSRICSLEPFSHDWTCPRCKTEWRVGSGIPVGSESCGECGWPQDAPTYKHFGPDPDDERRAARDWARARRARRRE